MAPPMCPMSQASAGFPRGPPVPLIVVPVLLHLVRSSADPKMLAYLKDCISKGGPAALAENAHRVAQYALARVVPSDVLYWFASRVLNLPADTAMRTTEFLKSRTELEAPVSPGPGEEEEEEEKGCREALRAVQQLEGGGSPAEMTTTTTTMSASCSRDIERRLERLERDYRALQERHVEALGLLTDKSEVVRVPRELASPPSREEAPQRHLETASESWQLVELDPAAPTSPPPPQPGSGDAQILMQDVGLRLGRIFLEWAGDTMKQTLVNAATRTKANPAFVGAGVDLAGRLLDAVVT